MAAPLTATAFAKINLTLRVIGRRPDGYHDIDSLVAFARLGDELCLIRKPSLSLTVQGPTANAAGPAADNLVLKAAHALAARFAPLQAGAFMLRKRLPVAAGLGGGSADAAAALRLLARANRLPLDDPRIAEAARVTGADVPVCLDPRARRMRGIGEILSEPVAIPDLAAVLVNPGVGVPTRDVFAALRAPSPPRTDRDNGISQVPLQRAALVAYLTACPNDLEPTAISLQPVIGSVLAALRALPGCRLARMSGSGATCFGLFDSRAAAATAAACLRRAKPSWWVRATVLGTPRA